MIIKEIETLKKFINEAEAIIIGVRAGLSTDAGFEYGGDYFSENITKLNRFR